MRTKVVHFRKAFEQMKKIYESRGLTVVETMKGKAEVFDENGVKKHELICSPEEVVENEQEQG